MENIDKRKIGEQNSFGGDGFWIIMLVRPMMHIIILSLMTQTYVIGDSLR